MEKSLNFQRNHRLLSQQDFSSVFKTAHAKSQIKHKGPYVVYRSSTGSEPRVGLSVAKKLLSRANKRNRVKRCIREFFRLNQESLSGDFIIRLKAKPHSFDYEALTKPLESLLLKKSSDATSKSQ
jgi:ribonuclease P protein component